MKKFKLYIMALMLLTGCHSGQIAADKGAAKPPAAAEISGIITSDTTLSGDVLVAGDVYVPEGVTLTILPGTRLTVRMSESTKVLPTYLSPKTELLVRGRIIAKGAKDDRIVFLSDQESAGMKDYEGIILLESEEAVFENCTFSNAYAAVTAFRSTLTLSSCEFVNCFYAISANGSVVTVTGNVVRDCDKGMYFHKGTTGSVTGSGFTNCLEDGIFIDNTSSVEITGNSFTDNLWGISTISYAGDFTKNNEFKNNIKDVRRLNY